MDNLHIWLVVGFYPSEKYDKTSVGMMTFPIHGKINNVSNHQPVNNSSYPLDLFLQQWVAYRAPNTVSEVDCNPKASPN